MTDERWEQLVALAKQKFEDVKVYTQAWELSETGQPTEEGSKDYLEFFNDKDGYRYRIVRENRPKVLDKKMHYSHRQGDTARVEYVTSDSELSHKITVYRELDDYDDEWEEARLEDLL